MVTLGLLTFIGIYYLIGVVVVYILKQEVKKDFYYTENYKKKPNKAQTLFVLVSLWPVLAIVIMLNSIWEQF